MHGIDVQTTTELSSSTIPLASEYMSRVSTNSTANNTTRHHILYDESHLHSQTIMIVTGVLLLVLLIVTCVAVALALLYRRRKNEERSKLKKVMPTIPELEEKEFEVIKGVRQDVVDILFDKKDFPKAPKKSSLKKGKGRSSVKAEKPQCQACLDRGNSVCQGHQVSRAKSASLKSRKDLNFIEQGSYYEHMQVQTDVLAVPDVHVYTKLEHAGEENGVGGGVGLVVPPKPAPRSNGVLGVNEENQYTNLFDASSGVERKSVSSEEAEPECDYEYSVPEDVSHYEELPN